MTSLARCATRATASFPSRVCQLTRRAHATSAPTASRRAAATDFGGEHGEGAPNARGAKLAGPSSAGLARHLTPDEVRIGGGGVLTDRLGDRGAAGTVPELDRLPGAATVVHRADQGEAPPRLRGDQATAVATLQGTFFRPLRNGRSRQRMSSNALARGRLGGEARRDVSGRGPPLEARSPSRPPSSARQLDGTAAFDEVALHRRGRGEGGIASVRPRTLDRRPRGRAWSW